jgi:hypothetical protein
MWSRGPWEGLRRRPSMRALALVAAVGCGDGARPAGVDPPANVAEMQAAPRSTPVPGAQRGVRVDLRDQGHHVRALSRQPDGTYRSVCIDAPAALRPATPRPGGHPDGRP